MNNQFDDILDFSIESDTVQEANRSAAKTVQVQKIEMFRATREENLKKIFPAELVEGYSYHFITSGDVDALSFLKAAIDRYDFFDVVMASTWTMSREDCNLIDRYLSDGAIKSMVIFTGEYFASRETAVYASIANVMRKHNGRLVKFKNHCKLILLQNTAAGIYLVIEGSANFTTNPRAEQTVVTASRELYNFYAGWFGEVIKNADRKT